MLALGSLGFLNSWDLPTFTALFLAALLVRAYQLRAHGVPIGFSSVVLLMLVIAAGAVALYAPFYALLDTQASGVLPVRRSMTRPLHFFIVWAPFLVLTLSMLGGLAWSAFRKSLGPGLPRLRRGDPPERGPAPPPGAVRSTSWPRLRSPVCWAVLLPLVPFALWALVELGLGLSGTRKLLQPHHSGAITESLLSIGSRAWQLLPLFVILSLALALLFRRASRGGSRSSSVQFVLLLIVFGFLLLMGAELFHISDFFGNRMNTVFKFYYQSWALLSVPAAFALYYWVAQPANGRLVKRAAIPLMAGGFAVVIAAAFVYVPAAIYSKTDGFRVASDARRPSRRRPARPGRVRGGALAARSRPAGVGYRRGLARTRRPADWGLRPIHQPGLAADRRPHDHRLARTRAPVARRPLRPHRRALPHRRDHIPGRRLPTDTAGPRRFRCHLRHRRRARAAHLRPRSGPAVRRVHGHRFQQRQRSNIWSPLIPSQCQKTPNRKRPPKPS